MRLYICCSANNNVPEEVYKDCENLLNNILKENDLVFGTCEKGLMGLAYQIAKKNHRHITGICPEVYSSAYDILECDEEIVTNEILDSTMKIIKNSDVIIVLPGGFGTIYELFTAIQSKICNEHQLPIIIYNSCGYYDEIISFMNKMYQKSFAKEELKDNYYIVNTPEEVMNIINKQN